ncbi:MAG TPA: class I SAM-dependent methyltransferase [Gemmatimonadales bacterium]|nr:class I SAM-dependent methyltransferase [Gemmatimonadales bacterium]
MADQSSNFAEFYIARTAWHAPAAERMRFRRAAAVARVPAGAAVLDIGARDGGLRHVLPGGTRYQGVEIDPAFAEPDILIHDISQGLPFPADSYDFAFCLEILEHLPDPFQAIGEIHRLLKPAGVLIVSVPNPYHFKEIIWNVLRIPDRQGHLYAWTRQTMARFGEMGGFRLDRTGGTYFHPPIPAGALLARSIIYRFVKV